MKKTTKKPGKWISEALESALKAVVYKEIPNEKESILNWLDTENKIPYVNDRKSLE